MKTIPRICKRCPKPIPVTRKKSALYCSDECYSEAKRERSSKAWANKTAAGRALKRNEKILDKFYLMVELGREIYYDDLDRMKFDFGISEGQTAGPGNRVGIIVGTFAYNIDLKTEKILLWKLEDIK
jgi:hypothetical protein